MNNLSIFNSDDFRRILKKTTFFLLLIFICDWSAGRMLDHIQGVTMAGNKGLIDLCLNDSADVYIFGSSRAQSHYIPELISQKCNLSVFNAAMAGRQMPYHFAVEQLLLSHHNPKLIVLEVFEGDFIKNAKSAAALSLLLPYQGDQIVKEILRERGCFEPLRRLSSIYPYNSDILTMLKAYVGQIPPKTKGYQPLYGRLALEKGGNKKELHSSSRSDTMYLDTTYLGYLKRFILIAKKNNIKILATVSPRWKEGFRNSDDQRKNLQDCIKIIEAMDIPTLDLDIRYFPVFDNPAVFNDPIHLNHEGAQIASNILAKKIQELMKNESVDAIHTTKN